MATCPRLLQAKTPRLGSGCAPSRAVPGAAPGCRQLPASSVRGPACAAPCPPPSAFPCPPSAVLTPPGAAPEGPSREPRPWHCLEAAARAGTGREGGGLPGRRMPTPAHPGKPRLLGHPAGFLPGLVLPGDAVVTRRCCPRPLAGLWSLPGLSLQCGPYWFKVCMLSPAPAPGLIKSRWHRDRRPLSQLPVPSWPHGHRFLPDEGPGSAPRPEPAAAGVPGRAAGRLRAHGEQGARLGRG